jgi:hypothetical protein
MRLPKLTQTEPRSRRGAFRRYRAVYRAYARAYDGGGMFGMDWPTLRLNEPEAYAYLQALSALARHLPE